MSEILRQLYCDLTNDHIVREPISLSCGHCVCKTPCLTDQSRIKCKICNLETNLENHVESIPIKKLIKSYLIHCLNNCRKEGRRTRSFNLKVRSLCCVSTGGLNFCALNSRNEICVR